MAEKSTPLLAVLQLLRKYNLKGTEEILRKEASLGDVEYETLNLPEVEIASILTAHHTESDPYSYEFAYESLKKFIESSLDVYKYELSTLLYPVFVHMYLLLIIYDHNEHAAKFLEKFGPEQEDYYQDDLAKLCIVKHKDQIKFNELAQIYSTNKFEVQLSRDVSSQLKRFLQEQKSSTVIINIINNHIQIDVHDGPGRNQAQVRATAGGLLGEATRNENRAKVYYGLLKEPEIEVFPVPAEDEEEAEETPDKPKKKKAKKENMYMKKPKSDPNAPPIDRIPLPELKETDKIEKVKALRAKRVPLGPDCLPSICFYTLLNSGHSAICADICDDSTLLAVGFSNSIIKVWTLTPVRLRGMKSADKLQDIDKEAGDVLVRMMEERDRDTCRTLYGHSGPVYKVGFDLFKTMLLSCSEDSTIRLWSLHVWTCLVVYRGHTWPVWDVKWSPHGHYFASCGHDRSARLWATDSYQSLRLFTGHFSDVDCVQFHPNSNYIATGSSDRTVRMWDCLTGSQVRVMSGHKSTVFTLAFSVCGRWLVSGGTVGDILVWDISNGSLTAALPPSHTGPIHALAFSRNGTILSSGSLDCTIKLWDFTQITEETVNDETGSTTSVPKDEKYLLRSFATKNSPIKSLHFTRRNLLLGVGTYEGSS
ncbi:Transcription initiation factor TFIID subunit 5 [Papilio machaon]|uniref:Transcription initiation factor TFIID subunit 5 n=1 Tax=Papilio machaon TaxID=76193 RepID=A0A194RGS6_PAPMA|nr:transcription initiation factor TFIID subunit 5 [Papilio machaon]KPJ15131.1 Transcription initiation factor TFIID subunit 5 [Papilio machaon]